MPQVQRSADIVEVQSEKAIRFGGVGAFLLCFAGLLIYYKGDSGMFIPLAIIVGGIGSICSAYAIYCALLIRKVTHNNRQCPYCNAQNDLLEDPTDDFRCTGCNRLIPIKEGKILPVSQVRCGFCNELNYFSEKTDCLLCEHCNHEIPIAHDEGHISKKQIAIGYAVQEDDRPYELILIAHGHKTDELIQSLQTMLALNRNQVKQMLTELPVTLLTGIPKRKAEMLSAQLSLYEAAVDMNPL